MSHIQQNLLVFGRLLRTLGLDVHLGRVLDVTEALQHIDIGARDEVYHTCRALLVHRHEDLPTFDKAFDAFWRADVGRGLRSGDYVGRVLPFGPAESAGGFADQDSVDDRNPTGQGVALSTAEDDGSEPDTLPPDAVLRIWSDVGTLARKDFAEFTPDEVAQGRMALDRLVWNPGERRTRRWVKGRGSRVDLRRALAQSLRTGGEVIKLPRRRRRTRPRPLVLLCDVSGSMERYSRMLLHFAHAMAQRYRRVEAFLFSTQLTRVTMQLRGRRLGDSVTAVSRSVPDWSGGTRIGAAIAQFHRRWTRRALSGGPVVLLVSDGWDRGDPSVLRDQVARLQRSCYRLIWLNPLIGTLDYAPLTRGLQAALPFVDEFLPARTLTDLADLAVHLNTLAGANRRA